MPNPTRKYQRNIIKRNQKYLLLFLLDHPCLDCKEPDPIILTFDHVRGKKRRNIADMARRGVSLATLQIEIDKCEIRCHNCHTRKTAKDQGWYKILSEIVPDITFSRGE